MLGTLRGFSILFLAYACAFCLGDTPSVSPVRPYNATNYEISMQFPADQAVEKFDAILRTDLTITTQTSELVFDAVDLTVNSVEIENQSIVAGFNTEKSLLTIALSQPLEVGEKITVVTKYSGKINTVHEGFFSVTDPDDKSRGNLYFTQFETENARRFYPCNDVPNDKATTETIVTVPNGYQVISNGILISNELETRTEGKKNKTYQTFHWKMERPHSTYLLSLAIGKFAEVDLRSGKTDVSLYVSPKKAARGKFTLESIADAMKFIEGATGVKYPWPKYATIGVPQFLWGGMENVTATHQNEDRTLLNDPHSQFERERIVGLAAHELAHQWFGDYVTLNWWDDLWLNESFANYYGNMATASVLDSERTHLNQVMDVWVNYFKQEDGPRSHAIVEKGKLTVGFDAINYTKGENVLRMLSYYVGKDTFKKGVKEYLDRGAYGNTTYADLFRALEHAYDKPLEAFRNCWIHSRGYPFVTYGGEWNEDSKTYKITIKQTPNHPEDKIAYHFRMPISFNWEDQPFNSQTENPIIEKEEQTFEYKLPRKPDWVSVNQKMSALAKVSQETRSSDDLITIASHDPDAATRLWAVYQLMLPLDDQKTLTDKEQQAIVEVVTDDKSYAVRAASLSLLQRRKTKEFPQIIAEGLLDAAKSLVKQKRRKPDWRIWESELLATLGKVKSPEVLALATPLIQQASLSIDPLQKIAYAVAIQGSENARKLIKRGLALHAGRGYVYKVAFLNAFAGWENPKAADEIRAMAKTEKEDFMGRIGWIVANNNTLLYSEEWPKFLLDFTVKNKAFSEETKARLLQTLEGVKSEPVRKSLAEIQKQSDSDRLRDLASQIEKKDFPILGTP